jgi:CheY-like chemotaxis protein
MPVMDGLEMAREMRRFESEFKARSDASLIVRPTAIVALSGLGSSQIRREAFGSGVDLFLSKPVRFKDLLDQVTIVLSRQEGVAVAN